MVCRIDAPQGTFHLRLFAFLFVSSAHCFMSCELSALFMCSTRSIDFHIKFLFHCTDKQIKFLSRNRLTFAHLISFERWISAYSANFVLHFYFALLVLLLLLFIFPFIIVFCVHCTCSALIYS